MVVIKTLVVYNQRSGRGGRERAWERLQALLPESFELERHDLSSDTLATRLAEKSYNLIIAIGGDGTVRSIVSTLQQNAHRIPIALIPRGTANIVAKSLGIPRALTACAAIISRHATAAVDCARINGKNYFIGAFALGYLSSRIVTTKRRTKRLLGFGGYIVSFIKQTRLAMHSFTYMINGTLQTTVGHTLFIANTTNVFGINSKRSGGYTDGQFELVVTTNKSFLTLPALIYEFYLKTQTPRHFVIHRSDRFDINIPPGASAQIDGEKIDLAGHASIEVLPRAQEFIIP